MRLSFALHHPPPSIERSRCFPLPLLSSLLFRSGMPVVAASPTTTFLLYRVADPISSWQVSSTQQEKEQQQWLPSPLRSCVLGRPG